MAQYGGYGNQSGYGQSNNRYDEPAGNSYGQPAANPYGQQATNTYGQQSGNPYGAAQSANPYSQTQSSNPYAAPAGNPYDEEQSMSGYNNNTNDIPMNNINGGAAGYGTQQRQDPRAILNDCQDLNRAIDQLARRLDDLKRLQAQVLDDPDASQNSQSQRRLNAMSAEITAMYQNFTARLTKLKSTPGAGSPTNKGHIDVTKAKLKDAIETYSAYERTFRDKVRDQTARQYRIARPDISESEIDDAVANPAKRGAFAQALMQSDRRGQSQSALRAVQDRNAEIAKIEAGVIEISQMLEVVRNIVVEQEKPIAQIQDQSMNTQEHLSQGNTQLDGAITKARAANRKKWYCLGILILIILVIVIIVVVVVEVLKNR